MTQFNPDPRYGIASSYCPQGYGDDATVAVDVDGDGIPDYIVRGADRDGDGIPDALQVMVQYTNVQTEKWCRAVHGSIAMHTTHIPSAVLQ